MAKVIPIDKVVKIDNIIVNKPYAIIETVYERDDTYYIVKNEKGVNIYLHEMLCEVIEDVEHKLYISKVMNKNTKQEVVPQYTNKLIKKYVLNIGNPLRVRFVDGCSFTHEVVLSTSEDDYGFWIETTNKFWRFDWK